MVINSLRGDNMKVYETFKSEYVGKCFKVSFDGINIVFKVLERNGGFILQDLSDDTFIKNRADFLSSECKELSKSGWFSGESGKYYFIKDNKIGWGVNKNGDYNPFLYTTANIFSTIQKVKEIDKEQTLYRLIKRYKDINDENIEAAKYIIVYNYTIKDFEVALDIEDKKYRVLNAVYFSSYEVAKSCIHEVIKSFYDIN